MEPQLSIVVPALNEQDNVGPLADEVEKTVRERGVDAELIIVDDGSTDATSTRLRELAAERPWLVVLRREDARGQSAAMAAGIAAARAPLVAFLDADLQNDPADLPAMVKLVAERQCDLVQGDRSHARQDHAIRKIGSAIGRFARRVGLGDAVRDTGCSARVMKIEYARRLPLQFKGMHRFIPAMTALLGGRVTEMPVSHRQRHSGTTKYGLGLLSRGPAGLADLLVVRWMGKRLRDTSASRVDG
jgi:glycosyltransferase involved in cell wall biosynthesis